VVVLVDMKQTPVALEGLGGEQAENGCSERARLDRAAALSSYNNSNNPRRGTDRLRGAS
jgi:hypothetical protein